MKKKIMYTLIIALLSLLLAACGNQSSQSENASESSVVSETEKEEHLIEVACIGDSITLGFGADEKPYVERLQDLLGEEYKVSGYGINGAALMKESDISYVNNKRKYVEQIIESSPEIVLIMLGTNDSREANWKEGAAEVFEKEYGELIERLYTMKNKPQIILATPPAPVPEEGKETAMQGVNLTVIREEIIPIVERVAARYELLWINMYAATEGHGEYFADTVHPNDEGHAIIAQKFYEELEQILEEQLQTE